MEQSENVATVQPSVDIAVLCDCPYAGKTREIKSSPETDEKKKTKLRQKIKEIKENICIARRVLMDTSSQLANFKRILHLELGFAMHPFIVTDTSWKDRVQEESYLKSELIHLVDYLQERDPRYLIDPACYPTNLSTSTEDLLLVGQENLLKDLYHGYTVYRSVNEKEASIYLRDFLKLKENYENKLYCNKIMEREIADTKKRISELQKQFLEDKSLIEFIISNSFKMKGTFLDDEFMKDDNQIYIKDEEAEVFKKMWEESEKEKEKIRNAIEMLKMTLEFANSKTVRAETVCSKNIMKLRTLTRNMQHGILLSKIIPIKEQDFGKFSVIRYRSQKRQLEAAINENRYLRNFLRRAVLSKTVDMKNLQNSLQSTAEKYRTELEGVRSSLLAAQTPK